MSENVRSWFLTTDKILRRISPGSHSFDQNCADKQILRVYVVIMKKILMTIALLLVAPLASAEPVSLVEITRYLNSMRAAQANFVQANPDNTLAQGVLYISKPGKIRYEYTVPNDSLVISDGRYLGIFDRKSNRGPQRYDLRRTPLDVLLSDSLDFTAAGVVRDIRSDGTQTRVVAIDPDNPKGGTITMVFTSNPTELRQWIVADPRGRQTTVILSDLEARSSVSASLFDISAAAAAMKR